VSTSSAPARTAQRARDRERRDSSFAGRAAAEELAAALKGVMAAVRRLRGRESRRPGELSDAQYGLLFGLCEKSERPLSELAALADVSSATATQMLDGLEQAGLVHRVRSDRDRRVVLTSLTDRGRLLVEERRAEYEPRWRAAIDAFSDDELRTTAAVLERLRDMFDQAAEER
jgi:DNA-binding MarR family transcriptional regulator